MLQFFCTDTHERFNFNYVSLKSKKVFKGHDFNSLCLYYAFPIPFDINKPIITVSKAQIEQWIRLFFILEMLYIRTDEAFKIHMKYLEFKRNSCLQIVDSQTMLHKDPLAGRFKPNLISAGISEQQTKIDDTNYPEGMSIKEIKGFSKLSNKQLGNIAARKIDQTRKLGQWLYNRNCLDSLEFWLLTLHWNLDQSIGAKVPFDPTLYKVEFKNGINNGVGKIELKITREQANVPLSA